MQGRTIVKKMDAAYFQQLRHARILQQIHHDKLIESGHHWDGMDGYEAPPGFTKADGDKLWNSSIEEAKTSIINQE